MLWEERETVIWIICKGKINASASDHANCEHGIQDAKLGIRRIQLTVVVVEIQRADTTTPTTTTTEKKRKAALVLDNAATSLVDRRPSAAAAGAVDIAVASGAVLVTSLLALMCTKIFASAASERAD